MSEIVPTRAPAPDGPAIDTHSAAQSRRLVARIVEEIAACGGWIPFDRFMHRALYEPALGYYAAKPAKLGPEGDFITAPEISPLFARSLAAQVAQAFEQVAPRLLEFGAGSGALAADLMAELRRLGCAPRSYAVVEVSADLRAVQQDRLRDPAVQWLDAPPEAFEGVIIANEVLDVMPVKLFLKRDGQTLERGLTTEAGQLRFTDRTAGSELRDAVSQIEAEVGPLPDGYASEVGLVARAWSSTLGQWLKRGLALLIDYGFPRGEYYHAQRAMGTLMCHFRHRAHDDPLWLAGLNDITAHVDFTAIARSARGAGLEVLGYASQARFLIDCGLLELMRAPDAAGRTSDVLRLVSEAEMGELLKVLAVGRGVQGPLRGFVSGDRSHRLD